MGEALDIDTAALQHPHTPLGLDWGDWGLGWGLGWGKPLTLIWGLGWGLGWGKPLTLTKQHCSTFRLRLGGGLGFRVGTGVGEGLDTDKAAL